MTPGPHRVRDLITRAHSISEDRFVTPLGAFVLVGPEAKMEDNADGWSYATRDGQDLDSANPFQTLLDSVVHAVIKKETGAAFGDTVLIGRAVSNDICIEDPSISKLHARVSLDGYVLRDAGSTNGTFVSEKRLEEGETHPLRGNLSITLGDRRFRVYAADELYRVLRRLTL